MGGERFNLPSDEELKPRSLSELREWVGSYGFFGLSSQEVAILEEVGDIPPASLTDITGEHEIVGETDA